ncbi:ADAMTS-like protein 1 [Exaiptasia diaphana]|uniref:Uncharacterized protein n=1 Tax=Exaiptasia diaphana TaxID=2652724 RepID=A0A913YWG3_EXADI|nr:ADAMTS-like protein 1 [Exaiptasia diaphana]
MARNALYAVLAGMVIIYVQGRQQKAQEKLDGGLSGYGPWSACDQVCGHNGTQKRTRTCGDLDGKDCIGDPLIRSCNSTNCPHPCSFDGFLIQLLNVFDPTIVVNNNQIATFSEIWKGKQ